tara:strand:+ start:121 stop:531 length:411 start_codon:yes stop_codon:yes gene_type:complete
MPTKIENTDTQTLIGGTPYDKNSSVVKHSKKIKKGKSGIVKSGLKIQDYYLQLSSADKKKFEKSLPDFHEFIETEINSVTTRGSKFSVTDKYQDKNIETLESDLKKLMKDDKSHDFNLLRFKLKAIGKDIVNYKKK